MLPPKHNGLYQRLNRFTWLMDLYSDNFIRLQSLIDFQNLDFDTEYGPMQDLNYTIEIKLSYTLRDDQTGAMDPSANIRIYLDSRQAEASHCYVGRRWQDVLGIRPSPAQMVSHRLRMNGFLNKWLSYLKQQHHRCNTWQPDRAPAEFIGS